VATGQAQALLRPPAHRGPLIAAGAVVLGVGVVLGDLRLGDQVGVAVHFLLFGVPAAVILALGLGARGEDERPATYQSVLLVTGLLLAYAGLLRLADLLGADFGSGENEGDGPLFAQLPPGAMTWTSLLFAGAASWIAWTRRSAVTLLMAAIAAGIGVLSALAFLFDADSQGPYRILLALLALGLVLGSLALRGSRPRDAQQLINAAGLAILVIPVMAIIASLIGLLSLFGGPADTVLPNFWELVVVAVGFGLVAYGAVDRVPGAAWLGLANLVAFVVAAAAASDETLLWWPLLLILIGLGAMVAGLRPLSPLPPEPDPYRAGEQPLAVRADEEITLRVRDDSPPS